MKSEIRIPHFYFIVFLEMKKIKKKMTGVIIGTASGLFFFALTVLAICQSRRATKLYVQSEEQSVNGDPDVVHEKAPPTYDDGTYTYTFETLSRKIKRDDEYTCRQYKESLESHVEWGAHLREED